MHPSDNPTYRLSPQLVASEVSGETVILDYEGGKYFGLDGVGSFIWTLLKEQGTMSASEICDQVLDTFEVEAEQCRQDVDALLANLKKNGLIESVV